MKTVEDVINEVGREDFEYTLAEVGKDIFHLTVPSASVYAQVRQLVLAEQFETAWIIPDDYRCDYIPSVWDDVEGLEPEVPFLDTYKGPRVPWKRLVIRAEYAFSDPGHAVRESARAVFERDEVKVGTRLHRKLPSLFDFAMAEVTSVTDYSVSGESSYGAFEVSALRAFTPVATGIRGMAVGGSMSIRLESDVKNPHKVKAPKENRYLYVQVYRQNAVKLNGFRLVESIRIPVKQIDEASRFFKAEGDSVLNEISCFAKSLDGITGSISTGFNRPRNFKLKVGEYYRYCENYNPYGPNHCVVVVISLLGSKTPCAKKLAAPDDFGLSPSIQYFRTADKYDSPDFHHNSPYLTLAELLEIKPK